MSTFILWLLVGITATNLLEWILKSNKTIREKYWDHSIPVLGYHLHHSCLGLVLLVIGLLLVLRGDSRGTSCLGFGLGLILVHTFTDKKLVFVEKYRH